MEVNLNLINVHSLLGCPPDFDSSWGRLGDSPPFSILSPQRQRQTKRPTSASTCLKPWPRVLQALSDPGGLPSAGYRPVETPSPSRRVLADAFRPCLGCVGPCTRQASVATVDIHSLPSRKRRRVCPPYSPGQA